jgi:Skp family chaperone for outer membrane proteins
LWSNPAIAQTQPPQTAQAEAPSSMVQKLFRPDSKVGFVDLQRVFNESAFGKQSLVKIVELQKTLSDGLSAKARDLQLLSEKIKTQQSLVDASVWMGWNMDFARMQREAQFAEQEAQIQVEQLQQTLMANFEGLVRPVIETVRANRDLWVIFGIQPPQEGAGSLSLLAADPAVDLSAEVAMLLNRQTIPR